MAVIWLLTFSIDVLAVLLFDEFHTLGQERFLVVVVQHFVEHVKFSKLLAFLFVNSDALVDILLSVTALFFESSSEDVGTWRLDVHEDKVHIQGVKMLRALQTNVKHADSLVDDRILDHVEVDSVLVAVEFRVLEEFASVVLPFEFRRVFKYVVHAVDFVGETGSGRHRHCLDDVISVVVLEVFVEDLLTRT